MGTDVGSSQGQGGLKRLLADPYGQIQRPSPEIPELDTGDHSRHTDPTWGQGQLGQGELAQAPVLLVWTLTVATILLTAAADSSSPLGRSTSVMPRYLRLKIMPSSRVSRVSVQFSGNSSTGQVVFRVLSRPGSHHPPPQHTYKGPWGYPHPHLSYYLPAYPNPDQLHIHCPLSPLGAPASCHTLQTATSKPRKSNQVTESVSQSRVKT